MVALACTFTAELNYALKKHGTRVFSQHGEDGMIASLIDKVGMGPGKFVEFGFGPLQNNTLAFAFRTHASGLYLDGARRNCDIATRMFRLMRRSDIKVKCAWIEDCNIDKLIVEGIGSGELDILSVDVDGNDYWFWRAITSVQPRITVVEYNASFGPHRAVTVPYDQAFERHKKHPSGIYHGMSLQAAVKLGEEKGHALVGCDLEGVNAFFVRSDLLQDGLQATTATLAFRPHKNRLDRGLSQLAQERIVYSLDVVEV
jgi:hypothetical protein